MTHRSEASPALRLGRIRYMNVAPIYWGLDREAVSDAFTQIIDSPAGLNRRMAAGELDVSPVSAAAFAAHHQRWLLLPDLCISCDGPVMSVLLASRRPLEALDGTRIRVSHDSASATALLKVLLADRGISTGLIPGPVSRADRISLSDDAVLVIGDAALTGGWKDAFPHCYDLGRLWSEWTGLPFVFAVWAVSRTVARTDPMAVAKLWQRLVASKTHGMSQLPSMARSAAEQSGLPLETVHQYYQCLQYDLNPRAVSGLTHWCNTMHRHGLVDAPVELAFFDPGIAG